MTFDKKAGRELRQQDERPQRSGSGKGAGRILLVLLCVLLAGGGTALMYFDQQRDYRHGVYRCEGGRMMEEPAAPDEAAVRETADGIQAIAAAHPELTQYMMLVPAAACVQSVYLPSGADVRNQAADLAAIRQTMPTGLTWIDLLEVLAGHAGEKLYYATDTWLTGWGSRYAAKAALTSMEAYVPTGSDKCFLLSDTFQGKLAKDRDPGQRFFQRKAERLEIYVPEGEPVFYREDVATGRQYASIYSVDALATAEPYDVFFGGERPLTEIHSTTANGETLLVVGDRTADSVVPLFVSSYENIILMHPARCGKSLESLIRKYQPGQILYLYGANAFMQDRALLHALRQ